MVFKRLREGIKKTLGLDEESRAKTAYLRAKLEANIQEQTYLAMFDLNREALISSVNSLQEHLSKLIGDAKDLEALSEEGIRDFERKCIRGRKGIETHITRQIAYLKEQKEDLQSRLIELSSQYPDFAGAYDESDYEDLDNSLIRLSKTLETFRETYESLGIDTSYARF